MIKRIWQKQRKLLNNKAFVLVGILICFIFVFLFYLVTHNEQEKKQRWIDQINIEQAWNYTRGNSDIIVGVIDSGIDISNVEFSSNIFCNIKEISGNKMDDDNNGFVDDIHGWNFYDNTGKIFSSLKYDYHGTVVSSIIAGNSKDYKLGIAPLVKILPLKCFRGNKGNSDDVVRAIEYGYNQGVRIFNCSWATNEYNEKLYNVIKKYEDCIFICASGNDSNDFEKDSLYPAGFDLNNIICVGGIDSNGELYKNTGYGKKIDIYAPATEIFAVFPEGTYDYVEGTSFATAFVTGTFALMMSYNNTTKGILNIKQALLENCNINEQGYPVLNAGNAVNAMEKLRN